MSARFFGGGTNFATADSLCRRCVALFFHLHDEVVTQDEEGCELSDLDAARTSAVHDARSLMAAQVLDGWLGLDHWIEITDADGKGLAVVAFNEAIEIQQDFSSPNAG